MKLAGVKACLQIGHPPLDSRAKPQEMHSDADLNRKEAHEQATVPATHSRQRTFFEATKQHWLILLWHISTLQLQWPKELTFRGCAGQELRQLCVTSYNHIIARTINSPTKTHTDTHVQAHPEVPCSCGMCISSLMHLRLSSEPQGFPGVKSFCQVYRIKYEARGRRRRDEFLLICCQLRA